MYIVNYDCAARVTNLFEPGLVFFSDFSPQKAKKLKNLKKGGNSDRFLFDDFVFFVLPVLLVNASPKAQNKNKNMCSAGHF